MKQYTVIFTPRALRQLARLYSYIADQSGEARAENYSADRRRLPLSLNLPERGSKHDDIRPNLRTKGYAKSVTIAFSVNTVTDTVVIHGIFYGGQDFESHASRHRQRRLTPAVFFFFFFFFHVKLSLDLSKPQDRSSTLWP